MVDNTVRRGGWTKQCNWAAGGSVDHDNKDVNNDKGEEAIALIMIMTMITRTKAGGGCEGTAHPGVGTTYDIVVFVPNANTRSSSTMTSALATAVIMAMLAAVRWGLA